MTVDVEYNRASNLLQNIQQTVDPLPNGLVLSVLVLKDLSSHTHTVLPASSTSSVFGSSHKYT
jgi:hypothetical protein